MRMVIITASFVALFTLAACNTVRGAGEDVSSGASTVQGWMR